MQTEFQLESLLSTYHVFNYIGFIQRLLSTKYKSDLSFSRKAPRLQYFT